MSAPPRAPTPELDSQPRHVLPRDLAGAIKHLDDQELGRLVAAALAELTRRGVKRRGPIEPARNTRTEPAAAPLTTGKLNAVRAAFKANADCAAVRLVRRRRAEGTGVGRQKALSWKILQISSTLFAVGAAPMNHSRGSIH